MGEVFLIYAERVYFCAAHFACHVQRRMHGAWQGSLVGIANDMKDGQMNTSDAKAKVVLGETPLNWIVCPVGAEPLIRYAAGELQKYLVMALGVDLEIVSGRPAPGAIYVAAMPDGAACPGACSRLPSGRYDRTVLAGERDCLYLLGENRLAVLYAVYDFLQLCLEVRFFAPGAQNEYVPVRDSLRLAADFLHYGGSAFALRDFVNRTNDPEVMSFAVKNRINSILGCGPWVNGSDNCSVANAAMIHAFGLKIRGPGHSWKHFVPDEELFQAHPEYFPMKGGLRAVNQRTACFANAAVRAIFLDKLRAYLRQHPYWDIFAFWAEDVPDDRYCDCDECRQLSTTDWYVQLVNDAAEVLDQEIPGALFELIVYQGTAEPPRSTKKLYRDGEKMLVNVCLGQTRELFQPLRSRAGGSAGVYDTYTQWRGYLDGVGYRGQIMLMEYYNLCERPNSGPSGRALLWPMRVIRDDVRFYREEQLTGLGAFTGFDRLCWPSPFNLWCWLQLWINPEQEVEALKDDFYPKFFGDLAPVARDAVTRLEELMGEKTTPENVAAIAQLPAVTLPAGVPGVYAGRMRLVALHRSYSLLLKRMLLAYLADDFAGWQRLKPAYDAFCSEHAEILRDALRPYPPLWFNLWLARVNFNEQGKRSGLPVATLNDLR